MRGHPKALRRWPRRVQRATPGQKRKATAMDESSENASPNASDVEKLLGGASHISKNLSEWIARQLHVSNCLKMSQSF